MGDQHVHHAAGERREGDLSAEALAEDRRLQTFRSGQCDPPRHAATGDRVVLLPEELPPYLRLDAVVSDHHVVPSRRPVAECHGHPVGVLLQVGDRRRHPERAAEFERASRGDLEEAESRQEDVVGHPVDLSSERQFDDMVSVPVVVGQSRRGEPDRKGLVVETDLAQGAKRIRPQAEAHPGHGGLGLDLDDIGPPPRPVPARMLRTGRRDRRQQSGSCSVCSRRSPQHHPRGVSAPRGVHVVQDLLDGLLAGQQALHSDSEGVVDTVAFGQRRWAPGEGS